MRVAVIGPQCSGKGTQAAQASKRYSLTTYATGDILRNEVAQGSELGNRVKNIINSGLLVDDNLIVELLKSKLQSRDGVHGFILDGFPRTLRQAELLEKYLDSVDQNLDVVVEFLAERDIVIERMRKRVSESCEGEARVDDTLQALEVRLDNYFSRIDELRAFYSSKSLLCQLDAGATINEVRSCFFAVLDKL